MKKTTFFVKTSSLSSYKSLLRRVLVSIILLNNSFSFTFSQSSKSEEYRFETISGSVDGYMDGDVKQALFRTPEGITVDSKGNIFITEYWTTVVRKISHDGMVSVLAGMGNEPGSLNGVGSEARFNKPHGLVVVGDSVIYVCDMKSHTIRKVTYGGVVTTYAGVMDKQGSEDGFRTNATFNQPEAIAVNSKGELFVADSYNFTIRKIALNGEVTTFAGIAGKEGYADGKGSKSLFNKPLGIAIDGKDNIYVADSDYDGKGGNSLIRKISPKGFVSTFAGIPMKAGHVDGKTKDSQFDRPVGITVSSDGVIFVADTKACLIRKIDTNGNVTTIGGTYLESKSVDGIGANARFADPQSIAVDKDGNLYITDTFAGKIRKGVKMKK